MRHQQTTHFGRAGKGQLAHNRAGGQNGTHHAGLACHQLEYTSRNTNTLGQYGQRDSGQGSQVGRTNNNAATGGQSRSHLAGNHGRREVPGSNGRAHTYGLLDHHNAFVRLRMTHHVAVHALGFFAEPLHKGSGVQHFTTSLGPGLALFHGHDGGQVVCIGNHGVEPGAQQLGTFVPAACLPFALSHFSIADDHFNFLCGQAGDIGQALARSRIQNGKCIAITCADPTLSGPGLIFCQAGILQFANQ